MGARARARGNVLGRSPPNHARGIARELCGTADDPHGSSRRGHNYPSPNAVLTRTHPNGQAGAAITEIGDAVRYKVSSPSRSAPTPAPKPESRMQKIKRDTPPHSDSNKYIYSEHGNRSKTLAEIKILHVVLVCRGRLRTSESGSGARTRPNSTRRVQGVFSAVLPVLRLELRRGVAHSRVLPGERSRPGCFKAAE